MTATDDHYSDARDAYAALGLDFDEAEYLAASGRRRRPRAPVLADLATRLRQIADHLDTKDTA